MDYETAASELVRALRGKRSQQAANRRLGFSSNVLHTWESGARAPSFSDFLRLASVSGKDVSALLSSFGGEGSSRVAPANNRRARAAWLLGLSERRSVAELARAVGKNRNTVARWLAGKSEPRLPDLLRYIDATSKRSLEFIASLVDPSALPSLRAAYRDLELQRKLAYDMPWAHAVLRALEVDGYGRLRRHQPGVIASLIGVDRSVEEECLAALHAARQIRKVRGKWRPCRVLSVDTRADPEGNRRVKRHWAEVTAHRLAAPSPPRGRFSYNLFAASDEALERIEALHLNYYERVRAIVEDCKNPTQVVLVNVQLCPLRQG